MPPRLLSEIEKDIVALEAYRQSRVMFGQDTCDASLDQTAVTLATLRSEATYQFAEWLFLLAGFAINDGEEFRNLIDRHNIYVDQLLRDPLKMTRMGLTKERLLNAIFDGEVRPRILKIWNDSPGTLDQSSIGRFLVTVMSDETARKTIVACGKAGFLERQPSVFKLVVVKSGGQLESIYGKNIREFRTKVEALARV